MGKPILWSWIRYGVSALTFCCVYGLCWDGQFF